MAIRMSVRGPEQDEWVVEEATCEQALTSVNVLATIGAPGYLVLTSSTDAIVVGLHCDGKGNWTVNVVLEPETTPQNLTTTTERARTIVTELFSSPDWRQTLRTQ
jgi:hypothetical protein